MRLQLLKALKIQLLDPTPADVATMLGHPARLVSGPTDCGNGLVDRHTTVRSRVTEYDAQAVVRSRDIVTIFARGKRKSRGADI